MITPGPVVIAAAFIGYLVRGSAGALVAAGAVILPLYILVIAGAPYYRRFARNARVKAFVAGVTAAAVGAITGAAFILGRRAIIDVPTAAIAVGTFGADVTTIARAASDCGRPARPALEAVSGTRP